MTATAHRDLKLGSNGPDVVAIQKAADTRLKMRNQRDYLCGAHDGQYGPKTARAVSRALYVLGCTTQTVTSARIDHGGHLSVPAQRVIRHPEIRSRVQRDRARKRLHEIRDTTIHDVEVHKGMDLCIQAAELALAHAPSVHYTQGFMRWQGIRDTDYASQGEYPNWADCSAFYSWCLWQLLGKGEDVVNGADWTGGYTGTLLAHGKRVARPIKGAAVLYGSPGSTGKHVAISKGDGNVISHGSEGGPYLLPWNYRTDVMEFRVYA